MARPDYEFYSEYAYKHRDGNMVLYNVYCGQYEKRDYCAIETLYFDIKGNICEIDVNSWDSGPSVFEVKFNPSDKSFIVYYKNPYKSSKKKIQHIISKNFLKNFDGDYHTTTLVRKEKYPIGCKDIKFGDAGQ